MRKLISSIAAFVLVAGLAWWGWNQVAPQVGAPTVPMPSWVPSIGGESNVAASSSGKAADKIRRGFTSAEIVPAAARASLNALPVKAAGSMKGYSRAKFPHWSKAKDFGWNPPQTGCDTREAALFRDADNGKAGGGCKITGTWLDPYGGKTWKSASDIDIDHMVPLAEAWKSGASGWTTAQRERYANDPLVLLSVKDNLNQSKGDKDPAVWKPPLKDSYCLYAQRWVAVKAKYKLAIDKSEKAALQSMLKGC